jgi:hypothetical protein
MALLDLSLMSCVREKVFGQIRTVKLRKSAQFCKVADFCVGRLLLIYVEIAQNREVTS